MIRIPIEVAMRHQGRVWESSPFLSEPLFEIEYEGLNSWNGVVGTKLLIIGSTTLFGYVAHILSDPFCILDIANSSQLLSFD